MTSQDDSSPRGAARHEKPRWPRRRWLRRIIGLVGGVVVLALVGVGVLEVLTRNPDPGEFYTPPEHISAPPGTVLRSEPFEDGLPADARGWRVLYASTDEQGDAIAVSGLVVAPHDLPHQPRPVLAWAHGTTGIARPCAPSLTSRPFEGLPDMTGPLDQGWVVALTDYPGLGTPSPHPYLVGTSEGRAVLDSVRATHQLDTGIELNDDYMVWGHSQGGHAALFAGQLADDYLPDLHLAAVAALAPATRLVDTLNAIEGTEVGNVLTVLAVEAWSRYYPDLSTGILSPRARQPARRIADACLNQPSRYRIPVDGLLLPHTLTTREVAADPTWTRRLDQNTPNSSGVTAPLFVAQGLTDELISPDVTQAWVTDRCMTSAPTTWRTYPDVDHLAIVGPGGDDALTWTIDQLDGPTPNRCPTR